MLLLKRLITYITLIEKMKVKNQTMDKYKFHFRVTSKTFQIQMIH